MGDLTPAELERVLEAHGHPGQIARGDKMVDSCPHCAFERYPCLTYRLAVEVQRNRARQLSMPLDGT